MRTLFGSLVAMATLTFGLAAAPAIGARSQRRHGYITGAAKTECGKALSKFVVNAYGFTGQEPNEFPSGSPPLGQAKGRGGRYTLRTVDSTTHKPANALVDSIEASAPLKYQGHTYDVPLYPTDGKAQFRGQSGKGIVRNFVLRTSGTKPGDAKYAHDEAFLLGGPDQAAQNAFYGASALLFLHLGDVPGQTLTLNFTPVTAKLADGCKARPLSRSVTLGQYEGEDNFFFQNIPLAFYTLTATLNGRPVLLALDGQDTTSPSVPFQPVPTSMFDDGSAAVDVSASLTSSPYGE